MIDRISVDRTRFLPWAAFALALLCLGLHSAYLQPWTLDDAYISYRYAANFAEGDGLVFNGGERVEGYTTFLWVLLLGLLRMAGAAPEVAAKVLGPLFAVGALLLTAGAHRLVPGLRGGASAAAVLALGTCGVFTVWPMSGMETTMASFWVLLAVLLHLRGRSRPEDSGLASATAVVCVLAAMSRPENGLVFAVLLLDRLLAGRTEGRRVALRFALVFAALYAPYFAWRWWYYGWLLPNTFYAKVGWTWAQTARGLEYVGDFVLATLPVSVPGLIGAAAAARTRIPGAAAAGALVLIHAVYVLAVGGDVMPAYRFFATTLPLICLLGMHALAWVSARPAWLVATACVAVVFNLAHLRYDPAVRDRVLEGTVGSDGRIVGLWMRENLPPDALIATNTAGSIPYFSRLRTVDMLGLNDAVIAHGEVPDMGKGMAGHEKGDGAYVLSRRPDCIQFGSALGSRRPHFRGERELAADPRFRRDYRLHSIEVAPGTTLLLFFRTTRD